MAMLRIELLQSMQLLTCETCRWGTMHIMPSRCPRCGIDFTHVRLLSDGREEIIGSASLPEEAIPENPAA